MVALVRYPNARAYLNMKATKAYEDARVHRRAALYDSGLIMTKENLLFGSQAMPLLSADKGSEPTL